MVSVEFLSLEYEQPTRKVERLGKYAVLTAGDALGHTPVLTRAIGEVEKLSQPSVEQVASLIEEAFIEERQAYAEKTVLRRVGLDCATFLERQRDMSEEIAFGLMAEYQKVNLDLELVVAGVDGSGAHLFYVCDPGVKTCFDAIGFVAIGSGLPHAESFLTEADYSPGDSVNRALWLCYVAKRRGERAPGVGKATDALIVTKTGVRFLDSQTVQRLDESYQHYVGSVRRASKDIEDSVANLNPAFDE
ncbi:MAG: hypothetical protein HYY01_05585 [Chloroflexi bacterium]|nr:hypothetical protein [Chloroflexota bacterium]